jgi:hypothetical protein
MMPPYPGLLNLIRQGQAALALYREVINFCLLTNVDVREGKRGKGFSDIFYGK